MNVKLFTFIAIITLYLSNNSVFAREHVLTTKYKTLISEARQNRKTATAQSRTVFQKRFSRLNIACKVLFDDMTAETKEQIHKLKGKYRGYSYLQKTCF